jgi:RimJ/RimL family protein N-acetyltransferase/glycosyltransferase involved in cell wall biosynthesis
MFSVLIRPLEVEDAEVSYVWRNDPEIWKFTGNRPDRIITEEIEDSWIRKAIAEPDSCRFAIEVDGQYVGNIQITNIRDGFDGQYHIFIGEKKFWGKGIAALATFQIIRFAREVLRLKQVYLFVNPLNVIAVRLYEKCGFSRCSDEVKMILEVDKSLNPTVSVQMITYNHESYIKRAIDSILMQKTNFDFEIIIGEDCSTDNTRLIIKQISDKYPGRFKLLLHEKNIGALANQQTVSQASKGKYIAICEGDDFWMDADKLQKQVDFLEKNADYGLVFGNVMILTSFGELYPRSPRHISTLEDLLRFNGIGTATTCFRSRLHDRFISETSNFQKDWIMGDYPFYLWIFQNSKMFGFDDYFAVYLKHDGSSTDFKSFVKGELFLLAVIKIKTHFYTCYIGLTPLNQFVKNEYESLFKLSLKFGKILKCITYLPYSPLGNLKFIAKLLKSRILYKMNIG